MAGNTRPEAGRTIVYAVTRGGEALAGQIAGSLDGAVVHGHAETRDGGLKRLVAEEFGCARALVFITATGIAVRMVAPHLKGKAADPAVVVVDESGSFAVSLLSGHLGGANELTEKIADAVGATPVITTATDSAGLPCAEDIAKAFGFAIEDTVKIKAVNSAIVAGANVVVVDSDPERLSRTAGSFSDTGVFAFADSFPDEPAGEAAYILVSHAADSGVPGWAADRTLVMRPKEFVLGLGCRRGVDVKEVAEACAGALDLAGISPMSIRNLATVDVKNDEAGLLEYAESIGLEISFFTPQELDLVEPPSGRSETIMKKIGCGGVSEPAAMISAGADDIWQKKIISGRVTVAIARAV